MLLLSFYSSFWAPLSSQLNVPFARFVVVYSRESRSRTVFIDPIGCERIRSNSNERDGQLGHPRWRCCGARRFAPGPPSLVARRPIRELPPLPSSLLLLLLLPPALREGTTESLASYNLMLAFLHAAPSHRHMSAPGSMRKKTGKAKSKKQKKKNAPRPSSAAVSPDFH